MRRLALLTLLALASTAHAQVQEGLVELGGSGSLRLTDGVFLVLNPTLGYFVTDRIEVGFNPAFATDFEDGSAFLTAFGALHFPSEPASRTVPFVGINLGASLTDGGGFAFGGQGGIKRFFNPGGALTVAAVVNADDSFDNVSAGVQAGVSIFLGRVGLDP